MPQPDYEYRTDPRQVLPKIPPETTLQTSISVARRLKWQAYFRLLYETGARPSEPFNLRVHDVDFVRDKVRLGTAKGSGYTTERELPISPLLKGMLQALTQGRTPEAYVFTKTTQPDEPLTYKQAQDVMTKIKRQLRSAGYSVEGLRLHIYRHAFGTRIFHATKDLALTARALGHRDLKDTMIYVHVLPDQPRRYDVVHVEIADKDAIGSKIAEGWEIAIQTPQKVCSGDQDGHPRLPSLLNKANLHCLTKVWIPEP